MKRMLTVAAVCAGLTACAAWRAGEGIANDRATGENARDVTFQTRGAGENYGWRQYDLPIGLTVLPWSCPNYECSVYGVRFNFGWGRYERVYGLDTGLFGSSREFGGVSATIFGNWTEGEAVGVVIGGVNVAGTMRGIQFGFVNSAADLYGVQIGLLNFNGSGVPCLPIINAGW